MSSMYVSLVYILYMYAYRMHQQNFYLKYMFVQM